MYIYILRYIPFKSFQYLSSFSSSLCRATRSCFCNFAQVAFLSALAFYLLIYPVILLIICWLNYVDVVLVRWSCNLCCQPKKLPLERERQQEPWCPKPNTLDEFILVAHWCVHHCRASGVFWQSARSVLKFCWSTATLKVLPGVAFSCRSRRNLWGSRPHICIGIASFPSKVAAALGEALASQYMECTAPLLLWW